MTSVPFVCRMVTVAVLEHDGELMLLAHLLESFQEPGVYLTPVDVAHPPDIRVHFVDVSTRVHRYCTAVDVAGDLEHHRGRIRRSTLL